MVIVCILFVLCYFLHRERKADANYKHEVYTERRNVYYNWYSYINLGGYIYCLKKADGLLELHNDCLFMKHVIVVDEMAFRPLTKG